MRLRFSLFVLCLLGVLQSRSQQPPGVVIDHQYASTGQYVGSPSIAIAPNGDYVASHDIFGPGSTENTSARTKVFISKDRGATWKQTAAFNEQFWSNLFLVKDCMYLLGNSAGNSTGKGRIVIRSSEDNGKSWSEAHYLTSDSGWSNAPTPVVIHDGRVYRAYEKDYGQYAKAVMLSAPVDSDLTDAANWSFSDTLPFPASADGHAWLEGNAVVAPDGSVVDVLAVRSHRQHAAIVKLDGRNLKLERYVDLPGGTAKFTIRFDPVSKSYWTATTTALPGNAETLSEPSGVRNTLTLLSSPDLIHWTPRTIVARHPEVKFHAFQYADWQFDGDDIILVSRTAFDDTSTGAHTYHDANYMTFHRIQGFRKLSTIELNGSPFTQAEVISQKRMKKFTNDTAVEAAGDSEGISSKPLGKYGTHTTTLTTRTKTGEAEQHRDWCDIFIPVAGEAQLVSGGHLADAKTTAPGEQRGSAVVGGTTEQLTPGAVVHIDPEIPHQLIVPDGKPFTYFVVKVKSEKALSK